MSDIEAYREFLKDSIRKIIDFRQTAQNQGVAPPPFEQPLPDDTKRVSLPGPDGWLAEVEEIDLADAIERRKSRRKFSRDPLSLAELTFLLWATQGVKKVMGDRATLRNVPSAGARHSLETYLFVFDVEGLEPGLYRYLPLTNELASLGAVENMGERLVQACLDQKFVGRSGVTFVWTTVPYRMEWRYSLAAHRAILLDAGHVCQNLYLACEAVGAGTCAIAAYDQDGLDALLGVDGIEEFAIYLAPVGKQHDAE